MEQITFRAYLQALPKAERGRLLALHMPEYEARLEAVRVPQWFLHAIGLGIRRNALLNKPVEYAGHKDCVLIYGDMDEDEIVRRYENSIQ